MTSATHPFLLGLQHQFGRRGRGVGGQLDGDVGHFAGHRPVLPGAQVVAGQVAGDLAQPRQQAVRVLQAAQVLPGLQEGFLGDVLAGMHVAGDRVGNRGDGVLAGADDPPVGCGPPAGRRETHGAGSVPAWRRSSAVGSQAAMEAQTPGETRCDPAPFPRLPPRAGEGWDGGNFPPHGTSLGTFTPPLSLRPPAGKGAASGIGNAVRWRLAGEGITRPPTARQ